MKPNPEDRVVLDDLEKALDGAPVPPWSHGPRFYPLGAHPATYRSRWLIAQLRRIMDIAADQPHHPDTPSTKETEETIAYHLRQIVAVEAGELEAKARRLREWADQLGRR